MKKIASILVASALTFSSCSDFLNVESQGKLTEDVFFGEEQGALMSINAIYTQLRAWNLIGFSWFGIMELPSDNSDTGSELADGSVPRLNTINNFTYDASTSELNGWWEGNYKAIASCNVALDNLGAVKNEALRVKCVAQARFFRGFFYFNLVRAFGGVPLITQVQQPGEYDQPRAAEALVYDQIVSDLTFAAENLPTRQEWGTKELGRVTKGTAEGLLAKVYLFRQDYANAKRYAGQVIDRKEYALHNDYRDLFSPDSYYSNEVMLADQYLWGESQDRNKESEYLKWQGIRGAGMGWGMFSPSEALDKAYEAGDPRRTATIFYDGEVLEGKGQINFKKEIPPRANKKTIWPTSFWNSNSFGKHNCHLYFLRYADVLLIYAEASNEIDTDKTSALAKLEEVRARARRSVHPADMVVDLPAITETDTDKLRELIWHERRVELALEGHRFYDLIRADKVVPGYAAKMLKAHGKDNFTMAQHATFFIPQKQIDISQGVLTQNK